MARSKPSKQLSQAEIERFLVAAEALHKSIIKPFISPHCEHYRATRTLHEALLKSVREVTGKEVEFIQWNTTGPVRPAPSLSSSCMPTLRDPQYRAFARRELYRRQGGRCVYCNREFTKSGPTRMTIEHRKAKMKGGKDDLKNLAAACWHCNHHRGEQMNETKQRKEAMAKAI